MIELFIAFIVGMILGYTIKKSPSENMDPYIKINTLQDEVTYYKKLTKKLVDENMKFRRKE